MNYSNINKIAYNDVENLSQFNSEAEIIIYLEKRKKLYFDHFGFIESYLKTPIDMVDIGSGSSSMLYLFEDNSILNQGIGVEYSKTRHLFADYCKKIKGYFKTQNINDDFINIEFKQDSFDCFFCIDNTFSLLEPQGIHYPKMLINKAYDCLRNEGLFILEVRNFSKEVSFMLKDKEISFWRKEENSPFKYCLYNLKYDKTKNHIISESIYVAKNGDDKFKKEISFAYTKKHVQNLIKNKFYISEVFCDFKKNDFIKNSNNIVFVLKKI